MKRLSLILAAAAVLCAVAGCAYPPTPDASSTATLTAPAAAPASSSDEGCAQPCNAPTLPSLPPGAIPRPSEPGGETPTRPCPDLTAIRAHAPKLATAALPATARRYLMPQADARSFTASVTAHDLTLAGIDVSNYAPTHRLILIVNHGAGLPVPGFGGPAGYTGTIPPSSFPTTPPVNWVVSVYDPQSGRAWSGIDAPDAICFNGG